MSWGKARKIISGILCIQSMPFSDKKCVLCRLTVYKTITIKVFVFFFCSITGSISGMCSRISQYYCPTTTALSIILCCSFSTGFHPLSSFLACYQLIKITNLWHFSLWSNLGLILFRKAAKLVSANYTHTNKINKTQWISHILFVCCVSSFILYLQAIWSVRFQFKHTVAKWAAPRVLKYM